ncbi:MAG TPA: hypothetical protein VGJ06_18465 [Candidatus Acidoferrum sp.]
MSQVAQSGFDIFLQEQFSAPASSYPTPSSDTEDSDIQNQFFLNAVNDSDQLRQRVALALDEL